MVRPVTFDADGAVFTGREKKTWQVSSARHEDRWRGEHAEFRSALCVFLGWKLSGFIVEEKKNTLTHPSIHPGAEKNPQMFGLN